MKKSRVQDGINPFRRAPVRLAVFDLDGTILTNTTACQQIDRAIGGTSVITVLEAEYQTGLIDSEEFARRALQAWSPHGEHIYRQAFDMAPKIEDLDRTLNFMRAKGVTTCLVTMGPRQFAECFHQFDYVYASDYSTKILNPEDKPDVVRSLQEKIGVSDDETIAYGDSDSDRPLFEALKRTIAVNASPSLASVAAHNYAGPSIWEATQLLWPVNDT